MAKNWLTYLLCVAAWAVALPAWSQIQTCPVNIDFSARDLSMWSAQTGLVGGGTQTYPGSNSGRVVIPEYTMQINGIQVITNTYNDQFGGFPTIPTINGYAYNYSVLLGSTATSHDLNSGSRAPGGFTRAITYTINVPPGPKEVPYTMTYAYAMVLENGTHNSNQQPLFKAILKTNDSIITCASPEYYLPTFNDAGGGGGGSTGATLDSAAAIANGFTNSPVPFFSYAGGGGEGGRYLYDVWTKGWTEVTFDLAAYRGTLVTLTFEADNCVPGGHFAYAYVALRNSCAGLEVSGSKVACTNNPIEYSIPALANATYTWTLPSGWTINSGSASNVITVTPGAAGGQIAVRQVNSCTDLKATIDVVTTPPTVAGRVNSDNNVCAGDNHTPLALTGRSGTVLNWVSSTDGVNWTPVNNTSDGYSARNLNTTTSYAAVVQNGPTCRVDTSIAAVITVDPRSEGGRLAPADMTVCANQPVNTHLSLVGHAGGVVNWLQSFDGLNWNTIDDQNSAHDVAHVTSTNYYRAVVKSGVCPADTSDRATVRYANVLYPQADIFPDSSSICYGASTELQATINIGTTYAWSDPQSGIEGSPAIAGSRPYAIGTTVAPKTTGYYLLNVYNEGCPNAFTDTFFIAVTPPILVRAGNDTSVVINESLPFNVTVNDPAANRFTWTPGYGLNNTTTHNPVALYGSSAPASITYVVEAATAAGCTGTDTVTVKIFKTPADIFMPSGFTPNGDGKNEIIRPICVGIQQLHFFRIYNRWGQLVFHTSQLGAGWDGRIGSSTPQSGTYVYMVQGVDYLGRVVTKKGTVVLVR